MDLVLTIKGYKFTFFFHILRLKYEESKNN